MEAEGEWGNFSLNSSMLPTVKPTINGTGWESRSCLLVFFAAAPEEIIELRFSRVDLREK